jgi:hypothetical protein
MVMAGKSHQLAQVIVHMFYQDYTNVHILCDLCAESQKHCQPLFLLYHFVSPDDLETHF